MMKAWRVTLWGEETVCYGKTRGNAIYNLWLQALSDSCPFAHVIKHIRARRAPELDKP